MGEIIQDRIARFVERTGKPEETMTELCQRVAEGDTMVGVCKEWDLPYSRLAAWVVADPSRMAAYEAALRLYADAKMGECVDIADEQAVAYSKSGTAFDPDVARDSLRITTRLKVASKLDRGRFGDTMLHAGVKGGTPIAIETIERVIVDPKVPRET